MSGDYQELPATVEGPALLDDLRTLIESARVRVAIGVNAEMVLLYWRLGSRIREDLLQEERATYGKRIVETVADQLTATYGRGFSRPNVFRMVRFAEVYPDADIVSTLSRQLNWSHFVELNRGRRP